MRLLLFLFCLCPAPALTAAESLEDLARDFFTWRTRQQPSSGDDIPRVERPADWVPRFSAQDLAAYQEAYTNYRARLDRIDPHGLNRSGQVDWLLVRAAMERVNWELNVLKAPARNPNFYVHQTLGALYELVLIQGVFDDARCEQIIRVMESMPATVAAARANLNDPLAPFARIAVHNLDKVAEKLQTVAESLTMISPRAPHEALRENARAAGKALSDYRDWLKAGLPKMSSDFVVGRDAYVYFLQNIALIPASPEELLRQGRQAWYRAVAFETYAGVRNAGLPQQKIFPDAATQIRQQALDEQAVRDFLEAKNIMTVPSWLKHYYNQVTPPHIAPLAHMGVVDDLTGPSRLDQDAVSYIPEPREGMSYFRAATAKDTRPIIVHEGVPGHYYQMARSWQNPNYIRRHYIDSGANEGIGFYVEEMLLQFGLFDDRPRTREIIYNFMRLRALRVEVDIRLALGDMSIQAAGDYLAEAVPMDRPTAVEEAGFFAMVPGQAITYQIGKTQILQFLAKARLQKGEDFDLRAFHDYLMVNGNVPIALLEWEYLNSKEKLPFLP